MMAMRMRIGTMIHGPIWKCLLFLAVAASRVAAMSIWWCMAGLSLRAGGGKAVGADGPWRWSMSFQVMYLRRVMRDATSAIATPTAAMSAALAANGKGLPPLSPGAGPNAAPPSFAPARVVAAV